MCLREGEGGESTYLTTGATLELVSQMLQNKSNLQHVALNSMPLWGMMTKEVQPQQVKNYKCVITVEDHLLDGGFGSWLMESTSIQPELLTRIKIKSLNAKVCGMVGKQSTMNAQGGLTTEMLCE